MLDAESIRKSKDSSTKVTSSNAINQCTSYTSRSPESISNETSPKRSSPWQASKDYIAEFYLRERPSVMAQIFDIGNRYVQREETVHLAVELIDRLFLQSNSVELLTPVFVPTQEVLDVLCRTPPRAG